MSTTLIALLVTLLAACRGTGPAVSENVPDIPVYPGAVLAEAVVGAELDPTEYYIVTDASEDEVLTWYAEQMPRRGWTATSTTDDNFVAYHTEEGCYGYVAAYALDDGTVEIQISQQRPDDYCIPYVTPYAGDD